jgi:uncharacterized protein (TIGR03437 family)
VLLGVRQAAPGIFTYNGNRAVVENPDYSVNSPSNPAHAGDIVTVYLTGRGSVSPGRADWCARSIGDTLYRQRGIFLYDWGVQPVVSYFGPTLGFGGLYQANLKVPALSSVDYPVIATAAGVTGNGPLISIR